MASPFTSVTVTGFNVSPPPDDGTASAANQLRWSKHVEKIGQPLKTAIEEINANLVAAFQKLPDHSITAAETAALVTPVNYQIPSHAGGSGRIYPVRYGFAIGASAATNTTALNAAIAVAANMSGTGAIIELPTGTFDFNGIVLQSNTRLVGQGKGFGVYQSTVLNYKGTGIAIRIGNEVTPQTDGFFSGLEGFTLLNDATGTCGVEATGNHFFMKFITIMGASGTGFSQAGYRGLSSGTIYSHLLEGLYVYGNTIGLHFQRGNHFVIDKCYIESNGRNILAGDVAQVASLTIINSVLQIFGVGSVQASAAETTTSINVDLHDTGGVDAFSLTKSYLEVNGSGQAGSSGQLGVNIRKCGGAEIRANWIYGGGQAVNAISAQAAALCVEVGANHFASFSGYAVIEAVGSSVQIGLNRVTVGPGVIDRTETPTPTGLTVVNGTGGATYSFTWDRQGPFVHFDLKITVTGDCTTAAAAGTTYFAFAGAMPAPVSEGGLIAFATDGTASYGGNVVALNSRFYMPAWAAVNKNITVTGSYRIAA